MNFIPFRKLLPTLVIFTMFRVGLSRGILWICRIEEGNSRRFLPADSTASVWPLLPQTIGRVDNFAGKEVNRPITRVCGLLSCVFFCGFSFLPSSSSSSDTFHIFTLAWKFFSFFRTSRAQFPHSRIKTHSKLSKLANSTHTFLLESLELGQDSMRKILIAEKEIDFWSQLRANRQLSITSAWSLFFERCENNTRSSVKSVKFHDIYFFRQSANTSLQSVALCPA